MRTKRLIALALSFAFIFTCMPVFASSRPSADTEGGARSQSHGLEIDLDGSDGYSGDYVMIYNPNESYSDDENDCKLYTGDLSGLISTEIDGAYASDWKDAPADDELPVMDVDAELAEYERLTEPCYGKINEPVKEPVSYEVGDERTFFVYKKYSPTGETRIMFKLLYKSEHCYVWTPSGDNELYYPLDEIDPTYAEQFALEFERIYPLMQNAFGEHSNGENGDGRVSLLFLNLEDGYQPGVTSAVLNGYFSSACYTKDGLPAINMDTYPSILKPTDDGYTVRPASKRFHTIVHEYQHCINYSQTGGMANWLNEGFSCAAEEICYPGTVLGNRIQEWVYHDLSANDEWLDPPEEYEYHSDFRPHNGSSIYKWESGGVDSVCQYAVSLFFTQYIYTHYGNARLRDILSYMKENPDATEQETIAEEIGMPCSELVWRVRMAMIANDPDAFGGLYGFKMQEGYSPEVFYGVENEYDLLGPLVFTGTGCDLDGGSAICVKPIGGVYYPPEDAEAGLVYAGITRHTYPKHRRYEPVDGIAAGGDYLIACETENGVYVLLPYNPDYPEEATEYYYSLINGLMLTDKLSYGALAELDEHGNIVGFDDGLYPNALPEYAEWRFVLSENGWLINSKCMPDRYLVGSPLVFTDSLYTAASENGMEWGYSCETGCLSLQPKYCKKDIKFSPKAAGPYNLFLVDSGPGSAMRLYKRVDGIREQYHTVTFLDRDGSVIMSVRLPVGVDPIPPAVEREGYTFLGWDGEFIGAAEDVTVTAVYSVNSYTLTIEYLFEDGAAAAPAYSETLEYGTEYCIECPEVAGYYADCDCIEGVMGDSDAFYTVIYYPEAVLLPGDADGDGAVSFTDVALMYLYLVGMTDIGPAFLANADYDGDGGVSFIDISELALMLT